MAQRIVVVEHSRWPERKVGTLIPGLHEVPTDREPVSIVSLDNGEIHAVPSRYVFTPEGLRYAEEWATKTHNTIHGVCVPDALAVR